MARADFCPDLIRRHNINGPRYTSYPTADQFREGSWGDCYKSALREVEPAALSLYLHVPFCATICYYCACNKINTANRQRADTYVQYLAREIGLHSELLDAQHRVEQLHFGGGTPTFLNDDQFDQLFDVMHRHFNLSDSEARDFSVEIDPRAASPDRIAHLAKLGINRISIGVQDFDPAVQIAVNRVQSVAETRDVIDAARNHGIQSINIDLINGLPKQTAIGFERTLDQVVELNPDRVSLYSYAHIPKRFKTQRQIKSDELPDADLKLTLLATAIEKLSFAGYEYIGMDHFAKPSDSLIEAKRQGTLHRNFQGYTTHGHCELIGLGVSSIGNIGTVYVQNAKTLPDYYAAIDREMFAIVRGFTADEQDLVIGQVIQDLMCKSSVDYAAFRTRTGVEFGDYFSANWPRLRELESDALLELHDTGMRVTERGRYLLRIICMTFDTYLQESGEKFSRAI